MSPPGNYQLRTNPFVCTVRRFADGTPGGRALRIVYRTLTVGRDDLGAPCAGTAVFVIARSAATWQSQATLFVQACSFPPSAAYADGGGMPPPYRRLSKLSVGLGHVPAGAGTAPLYKPVFAA